MRKPYEPQPTPRPKPRPLPAQPRRDAPYNVGIRRARAAIRALGRDVEVNDDK